MHNFIKNLDPATMAVNKSSASVTWFLYDSFLFTTVDYYLTRVSLYSRLLINTFSLFLLKTKMQLTVGLYPNRKVVVTIVSNCENVQRGKEKKLVLQFNGDHANERGDELLLDSLCYRLQIHHTWCYVLRLYVGLLLYILLSSSSRIRSVRYGWCARVRIWGGIRISGFWNTRLLRAQLPRPWLSFQTNRRLAIIPADISWFFRQINIIKFNISNRLIFFFFSPSGNSVSTRSFSTPGPWKRDKS